MKLSPRIALSIMTVAIGSATLAQNKPAEFDAEIKAGAEYDSTLAVAELDRTSREGDWAAIFNGRVGAKIYPTERLTLKGGYSYAARNYRQNSQFDQDLHTLSLDAGVDFAGMTLGVSHHFARALLASEPFLDLSQTSLYAGKLYNNGVYLRGAASRTSKRFENNTERDSEGGGLSLDAYYFINDARSFWSVGLGGESEDARASELDNRALKLRARYSHKGEMLGKESRVQLGWRYLDRDYHHETPVLGTSRRDQSQVVDASWSLGLNELLTLESKVEYGDYNSNLEAADYRETGASILLSAEF